MKKFREYPHVFVVHFKDGSVFQCYVFSSLQRGCFRGCRFWSRAEYRTNDDKGSHSIELEARENASELSLRPAANKVLRNESQRISYADAVSRSLFLPLFYQVATRWYKAPELLFGAMRCCRFLILEHHDSANLAREDSPTPLQTPTNNELDGHRLAKKQ